jgi:hypothetical protein
LRKGKIMPKCGVCGDYYGELMVKHAELCDDDSKAEARPYAPEIDDIIRDRRERGQGLMTKQLTTEEQIVSNRRGYTVQERKRRSSAT